MSATATATYAVPIADHFAFSFSPPDRFAARPSAHLGRSRSDNVSNLVKSSMNKSRGGTVMADDVLVRPEGSESSRASTPNTQPQTWLRRLSSSVSKSRDSSSTTTSRPASAVVSHSNGSWTFSHSGSTTPMLPGSQSVSQPRNRLVKRSSSVRSVNTSSYQSSGTRLPMPTFRRPATSHQRSATLHEPLSPALVSPAIPGSEFSTDTRDPSWRHYFTPKIARAADFPSRRPSVSGIPNPIKRIYPDRKYKPTLVSAQQPIRQGDVEADDELSTDDDSKASATATSATSSPILSNNAQAEGAFSSRRSFSFSNLLSNGPSPLSRGSSRSRSQTTNDKLSRSTSLRIGSAPRSSMGTSVSSSRKTTERLSKRRNVSNAEPLSHSNSDTTQGSDANPPREIQLHLGDDVLDTSGQFRDAASTNNSSHGSQQGLTEQRRMPSTRHASGASRPSRHSAGTSEIVSTLGSDAETQSVGDTSTDYQSDAFDSFPTRTTTTTRSSSGKRGPPIETIFDESPPTFSSGRSTKLRDFLNTGGFPESDSSDGYRYSTIEEEESIATPKRSLGNKNQTPSPSARFGGHNVFSSSPPVMREMPHPDDIDWDAPEEPASSPPNIGHDVSESPRGQHYLVERSLPLRLAPPARSQQSLSTVSTPRRNGADRATIFDWAEVQPSPNHSNSPPRPKTVHGKKDPENRGSRHSGRRMPSGMHARSHSVPVVPDLDGKRSSAVANKFGTWGVGSKGVTEDWNEDFDFEEPLPELPSPFVDDKRVDSGHAMLIPKAIQEQQQNVVANIGLLREWGLLIEELKDLRIRAAALGMLAGPHAEAWSEVDAMIDLADQESHESTLEPRRSPPSSPGFDDSAFDEPTREAVQSARARARSIRTPQPILTLGEDHADVTDEPRTPVRPSTGRPRKDSEAVARSVIEALQRKRTVSDPTSAQTEKPAKKVPFDTATLRHIVPYVNGVKRKIKEALREAEGLYTSPRRPVASEDEDDDDDDDFDFGHDEPSFRSIFTDPRSEQNTPERSQYARRQIAITDNDEADAGGFSPFG